MKASIFFRKELLEHTFGEGHTYRVRERLQAFFSLLREKGLVEKAPIVEPQRLADEGLILEVHHPSLLQLVKELSEEGGWLDSDTPVPKGTFQRILIQLGYTLEAGERVCRGEVTRGIVIGAFGGHHATRRHVGKSFGFCYFNNSAILVKHLQKVGLAKKVLILDLDGHHGNGLQEIFYEDPTVLYISLHMDPLVSYPGTGFVDEIGEGEGRGYTVNVPLPPLSPDELYLQALDELFIPLAQAYQPDLLHLVFGSDGHYRDPLSNLAITLKGYLKALDRVVAASESYSKGRLLIQLAGGYDIPVAAKAFCLAVARCAEAGEYDVEEPHGDPPPKVEKAMAKGEEILAEVKERLRSHWPILR